MKSTLKKFSFVMAVVMILALAVTGCGTGQQTTTEPTPEPTTAATPEPTAEPTPEPIPEATPIVEESPMPPSYQVGDITVQANMEPQELYTAKNTLDGDVSEESRWSAEVDWAYITYDLGEEKPVKSVDVAFAMAANQQTTFDIAISTDGVEWKKVLMQQTCEPIEGFQNYAFEFTLPTRYVRVIGHYNNTDEWGQWISISEVQINDADGKKIDVAGVKANREPQPQYTADLTIDGDVSDESRWSAEVNYANITYDLGSEKVVESVDLAWAFSSKQQTNYDIAVSTDGINFTRVIMNRTDDMVDGFQNNKFDMVMPARYVRISGRYNSTDEWAQWISLSEVKINTK